MASEQIGQLSNLPGENMELKMKLTTIAENIRESATGIGTMSEKTSMIKEGTENTSAALSKISNQLKDETSSMASGFITMGEKLEEISEGLGIFHTKSGMMAPNIPETQEELDNLLYDDDLELKSIFSDVAIDDNNLLMMVKLEGNLEDENKDKIYENLFQALEKEEFEDISYIISGKPVLDSSLRSEMKLNMKIMVFMAVVLMTSKFVILKDFGLMTVINISLALISTFIILPAVLVLLDRFIVREKKEA